MISGNETARIDTEYETMNNDKRSEKMMTADGNVGNEKEMSAWEQGLRQLRQNRQAASTSEKNDPHLTVPTQDLNRKTAERKQEAGRLDGDARDEALRQYLWHWQREHNVGLSEKNQNIDELDATVLLQDDWLSAQASLQGDVAEADILKNQTVWLKSSNCQAKQATEETDKAADESKEKVFDIPTEVPVVVQVLKPEVVTGKPVLCLSERELLMRLEQRLLPHLTDAVNGMVRVAMQKQIAVLTRELQQALSEETPDLVQEVLEHNLKMVLSEIRYELKFKR